MPSVNPYDPHQKKPKKQKVVLKRRYVSDKVEVEEKPPPKPPKVHDTGVSDEVLSGLVEGFDLMYDPNYFGHLEFDEQLKKFKSRDLLDAKLYKTALKAFGNQRFVRERLAKDNGRKRVFVAQQLSELRGFDSFSEASSLPSIQQQPQQGWAARAAAANSEVESQDADSKEQLRYQQWLKNRQTQHQDLEKMGDVERYLRGKGQLSSMERAALNRIDESRRPKKVEQVEEEVTEVRTRPSSKVSVKRPSPLALFIIDNELRKRKLRLSDLFTSMDKDKDWLLTRQEFRKAMRQHRVPLPEPLLEDMIITLDQDNNNQLDYQELAQGLDRYRRERRTLEFLALLSEESNQFLLSRESANTDAAAGQRASPEEAAATEAATAAAAVAANGGAGLPTSSGSASPGTSGSSPQPSSPPLLRPGEFDTSQERYSVNNAEASAELRRRDQVALRNMRRGKQRRDRDEFRSMVKTFDRDIDDHVTHSSLPERPLAEMVDGFRQRQLREFMDIVETCKQRDAVFSERLLRRVLLYPADRTRKAIGDDVSPPSGGSSSDLPASVLLRPSDRAALAAGKRRGAGGIAGASTSATGAVDFRGGGVGGGRFSGGGGSFSGGDGGGGGRAFNLAGLGRVLPSRRNLLVDDDDAEQELPTGTAQIRRKVDCWLTFEEFQQLTAGLKLKGQAGQRPPRKDAFWPGRLEGRVRRFLDEGLAGSSAYGPNLMFQATRPQRGQPSHPYLPRENWPVVNGHVTYASIDPMLAHEITGPRSLQGARVVPTS